MIQTLRPYQERAVSEIFETYRAGSLATLLVLPTGGGKTTVASEVCRRIGGRVLWVAHRRELLAQGLERLQSFGLSDVVATSAQALLSGDVPPCDFAVLDECHHFPSENEWAKVAATLRARGVPALGLTATPQRADGLALGSTFERLVVGATPSELTALGFLCPLDVFAPPEVQKGLAMTPRESWERFADGRRTVVFCSTVADAEREREAWGEGEVIHGKLGAVERARRLASPWRVLFNVFVLTEGWDVPEVKCAILARKCGSVGTYLQIAGRILRPHPSYTSAVLVDLVGTSVEHGHPCDDRECTLDGRGIKAAETAHSFCQACGFLLLDSSVQCDRCGFARETREQRERRITGAKLERLERNASHDTDKRVARLADLMRRANAAGYKPGWAAFRFKGVYSRWPTREETLAAQRAAS